MTCVENPQARSIDDADLAQVLDGIAQTLRGFEINLIQLQDALSMEFEAQSAVRMPMELQLLDRSTQGIAAIAQFADRLRHALGSGMSISMQEVASAVRPVDVRDRILQPLAAAESSDVHIF